MRIFENEGARVEAFPVAKQHIFLAHAGVTVLPACASRAMAEYVERSCERHQEFGGFLEVVRRCRERSARLIGAGADEVALLGPTSLGLSLVANGLAWREGDEVVCYAEDYPANVYPWMALERRGVVVRRMRTGCLGRIEWGDVEAVLSERTRLVALSSCHYLTGWRLDVEGVGRRLRERGVLFCLDAIQTVGAFEVNVKEVDFLSADAHKWMLGPMAVGIVYVARRNFEVCEPTLVGAWNVRAPEFLAQDVIEYEDTARRYEPGVLNAVGIYGMEASLGLLESVGMEAVGASILEVRDHLERGLEELGFEFLSPRRSEAMRSGILTGRHPGVGSEELFGRLSAAGITVSLRKSRDGGSWLRFSPHFYNTVEEMDRVVEVISRRV